MCKANNGWLLTLMVVNMMSWLVIAMVLSTYFDDKIFIWITAPGIVLYILGWIYDSKHSKQTRGVRSSQQSLLRCAGSPPSHALLKTEKEEIGKKDDPCPFTVVLTLRTKGKKRGIHFTTQELKEVIKASPSQLSPYTNFDMADGTRVSIHRDRLLGWRSHIQE